MTSVSNQITRERSLSEPSSVLNPIPILPADPAIASAASSALSKPNSMTIRATPSRQINFQAPHAIATLFQENHPHTYSHTSVVLWENKRYRFTLDVPLSKEIASLSTEQKADLDSVIDDYKTTFLTDLGQHKNENIKPGADFSILYTNDGYTAIPANPSSRVQDLDAANLPKNSLIVNNPKAKELSNLIQCCDINKMREGLNRLSPNDSQKKEQVLKEKTAESGSISFQPIGFKNVGNSCYLSAGLQIWLSNPVIRKELLKEGVIPNINGQPHPLKSVVSEYEKAQSLPLNQRQASIDLTHLRDYLVKKKLSKNSQEDAHEALLLLKEDLHIDANSPLHATSQSGWTYRHPEKNDGPLMFYASGEESVQIAEKAVTPTDNASLADLLKASATSNITPSNKNPEAKIPDPLDSSKQISVTRLHQKTIFTAPPNVLVIHIKQSFDGNGTIKNPTEVDADLTLKFAGDLYGKDADSHTDYDFMGFLLHKGIFTWNGHYIAYVRDGKGYWEMNDNTKKAVSKEVFLKAARSSYVRVYNKKEVGATSPASPAPLQKALSALDLSSPFNGNDDDPLSENGSADSPKIEERSLVLPPASPASSNFLSDVADDPLMRPLTPPEPPKLTLVQKLKTLVTKTFLQRRPNTPASDSP